MNKMKQYALKLKIHWKKEGLFFVANIKKITLMSL